MTGVAGGRGRAGLLVGGWVLLGVLLLAAPGCDSGNPVAPTSPTDPGAGAGGGSETYTISITADPTELQAGSGTPTTLTVVAKGVMSQMAPPDGTSTTLSTDLGSLGVDNEQKPVQVATLSLVGGRAQVSFFGGSAVGTATILAKVGGSVGQVRVPVVDALPKTFYLSSIQPATGPPEGGTVVTISGAGFEAPVRVTFGGVVGQVVSVASNTLQVQTPPSAMAVAAGASVQVDVTVTNVLNDPAPPSDTLAGAFAYTRAPQSPFYLTGVNPSRGSPDGGDLVFVSGQGWLTGEAVQVEFDGVVGQGAKAISATKIEVVVPPSKMPVDAGTTKLVDVVVTLDPGTSPRTATLPGGFGYQAPAGPAPVLVTSISPTQGPYSGGTSVTVTGSGFEEPVSVELGGVAQTQVTSVTATRIVFITEPATVSACPASGTIPVQGLKVTDLGNGQAGQAAVVFNYQVPSPSLSAISPRQGSQAGGLTVTVSGTGLDSPARVLFVASGQELLGTNLTLVQGGVQVRTPAVPTGLFPQYPCTDGMGNTGVRYGNLTVDVEVVNQATGCLDTLPGAFTYVPTDTSCRIN